MLFPASDEYGLIDRRAGRAASHAVIDFDKVVRDPNGPLKLRADFDGGDHVHPDNVGNRAMADAAGLSPVRSIELS